MRQLGWPVIAAFLLAAACGRQADTEENVKRALDEANMRAVEVDFDVEARVVHLQGTVDTIADRARAEEIAAAVVGTSGRVVNELTVDTLDAGDAAR